MKYKWFKIRKTHNMRIKTRLKLKKSKQKKDAKICYLFINKPIKNQIMPFVYFAILSRMDITKIYFENASKELITKSRNDYRIIWVYYFLPAFDSTTIKNKKN